MGSYCPQECCDRPILCCGAQNQESVQQSQKNSNSSIAAHEINIVPFEQEDEMTINRTNDISEIKHKPSEILIDQNESIIIIQQFPNSDIDLTFKNNKICRQLFIQLNKELIKYTLPSYQYQLLLFDNNKIKEFMLTQQQELAYNFEQQSLQFIMQDQLLHPLVTQLSELKQIKEFNVLPTCYRENDSQIQRNKFQPLEEQLQKQIQFLKNLSNFIQINNEVYQQSIEIVKNNISSLIDDQCFELIQTEPEITQSKLKQRGIQHLNKVKQNNNSFFTALGFQFLNILLFDYDDQQFEEFLNGHSNQRMQISINNKYIFEDESIELVFRNLFFHQLSILKKLNILNRKFQLDYAYQQLNNNIPYFYQLSVIFFRNLCNDISSANQSVNQSRDLLDWNSNINFQIFIEQLAQKLQIHINLVIQQERALIFEDYCEEEQNQIIFINQNNEQFNIGISDQSQRKYYYDNIIDEENELNYVMSQILYNLKQKTKWIVIEN